MGYYRGDHYRSRYRGDYYRGDPGFFSFLGRVLKPAIGAIRGFVAGGPVGGIIGAVGGTVSAVSQGVQEETLAAGGSNVPVRMLQPPPGGIGVMAPGGGRGIITESPLGTPVSAAAIQRQLMPHGMKRVHPNKSTYVTRGGGTSHWPQGLIVHPKGSEAVVSRRMNVGNARALRRALRRARGFAKLAHRVLRTTRQFKGKGFGRKARR